MKQKTVQIDNLNSIFIFIYKMIQGYKKTGYKGWEHQEMTIIKTGEQYTLREIDQIINN